MARSSRFTFPLNKFEPLIAPLPSAVSAGQQAAQLWSVCAQMSVEARAFVACVCGVPPAQPLERHSHNTYPSSHSRTSVDSAAPLACLLTQTITKTVSCHAKVLSVSLSNLCTLTTFLLAFTLKFAVEKLARNFQFISENARENSELRIGTVSCELAKVLLYCACLLVQSCA